MPDTDEPIGADCPSCSWPAGGTVGDTAFCVNNQCDLVCWDMEMTLAEHNALPVNYVDLT